MKAQLSSAYEHDRLLTTRDVIVNSRIDGLSEATGGKPIAKRWGCQCLILCSELQPATWKTVGLEQLSQLIPEIYRSKTHKRRLFMTADVSCLLLQFIVQLYVGLLYNL
jgi:hypothetical protein